MKRLELLKKYNISNPTLKKILKYLKAEPEIEEEKITIIKYNFKDELVKRIGECIETKEYR